MSYDDVEKQLVELSQRDIGSVSQALADTPLVQETELGSVVKFMNEDSIEKDSSLSSIDPKTRLKEVEISSIVCHDVVIALGALPTECAVTTRSKKRLAVSLDGQGRKEIVEMVRGEKERRTGGSFLSRMFGGQSA